ncbi:MAG: hypothetical protein ABFS22_09620 [Pseudomonadota bacterium]
MNGIIPLIVAWLLLVLGLSYAINTVMWLKVTRVAMAHPERYLYFTVLTLALGLAIVISHNVWIFGWPVVVTLFGWIMVIKSTLFLLFPGLISLFDGWSDAFLSNWIRVAGIVLALIGAGLVWRTLLT